MSQSGQPADRWAIVVGIDGYHESLGPLACCAADARLLRETLLSPVCGFPAANVLLLADEQPQERRPTYGNLHSWLSTWLARPAPEDLVVVYFAGHGREVGGKVLLAPQDATLDSLHVTGVPIAYIHDLLDRCQARRKVLILDTCHSGAGRDIEPMTPAFRAALDHNGGLYSIASCDAHQISYEWPDKGHGVFTHYLAQAIRGGAPAQGNGDVTLDAIYAWTTTRVSNWAASRRLSQTPVRHCRTSGQIVLANRSQTLTGRLSSANEELADREAEVERLAAECQALRERLRAAEGQEVVEARPVVVPARVPEWREWARHRMPGHVTSVVLFLITTALVGPPVGLVALLVAWLCQAPHPVLIAVGAALALPTVNVLRRLRARGEWRNRYRLLCAQVCAEAGDYLGGASYAEAMGRAGIDRGTGGAVLVRLANLALDHGDTECARRLYRHAQRHWRSPHAGEALRALPAARHAPSTLR
ncbi:MAG: caspase family protein [bacterium]